MPGDGDDDTFVRMRHVVDEVLDAYGGRARWDRVTAVAAHYRLGGDFLARKGASALAGEGEVTVWVKDQRVSMRPFGGSDLKSVYCPTRVSIETVDDDLIEILPGPRSSFDGHTPLSPWTDLQAAYFTGCAMWTDLAEPFSLAMPGVTLRYDRMWQEGSDAWRRLRVHYPPTIVTHSAQQTLYVDDRGLIRRRDYAVDIAGGLPTVQYVGDFASVGGILVPTTHSTYLRDTAGHPIRERLEVSIELTDVRVL